MPCSSASIRTTSLRAEGGRARSRTSRGGSSGSASGRDPLRLGQPDREVGDDRAGASRRAGWPTAAIRAASSRTASAVVARARRRTTAAARPRRGASRRSPSSAPSQATGRVQPSRSPTRAIRASSASSAETPAGPGPGRRRGGTCPTSSRPGRRGWSPGTSAKLTMTSGRIAAAADRPRQGEEADERDREPGEQQDAEQVVGEARRPASRPAAPGPTAR